MLLGNENLLSKIIKRKNHKNSLDFRDAEFDECSHKRNQINNQCNASEIKLFKWWLYSSFFFTVMLWTASIKMLLGLVAYLSSCFKFLHAKIYSMSMGVFWLP